MLPPKLNWGQLLVDNVASKEFEFLRLLFPMQFMNEAIIPLTTVISPKRTFLEIKNSKIIQFPFSAEQLSCEFDTSI